MPKLKPHKSGKGYTAFKILIPNKLLEQAGFINDNLDILHEGYTISVVKGKIVIKKDVEP